MTLVARPAPSHNALIQFNEKPASASVGDCLQECPTMSEKIYDVPAEWSKRALVDTAKYQEMYARSIKDPDGFWGEHGKRIDWTKPFT
jgi:hypothetical protein